MIGFDALNTILDGISMLYWALALALLVFAIWKNKGWKARTLWALPVICVFGYFPVTNYVEYQQRMAFSKQAWAYFKNLCDTKSGEKIYKTFSGIRSVQVIKPLPPAEPKDLFDQFWYGDPYSYAHSGSDRTLYAAESFLFTFSKNSQGRPDIGLAEIEIPIWRDGESRYQRMTLSATPTQRRSLDPIKVPQSRFGLSWNDISTPEDRKYWVAASQLKIIDLTDNSVVAERIGYLIEYGFGSKATARTPWQQASSGQGSTCPPAHSWSDRQFVLNVLNPIKQ